MIIKCNVLRLVYTHTGKPCQRWIHFHSNCKTALLVLFQFSHHFLCACFPKRVLHVCFLPPISRITSILPTLFSYRLPKLTWVSEKMGKRWEGDTKRVLPAPTNTLSIKTLVLAWGYSGVRLWENYLLGLEVVGGILCVGYAQSFWIVEKAY